MSAVGSGRKQLEYIRAEGAFTPNTPSNTEYFEANFFPRRITKTANNTTDGSAFCRAPELVIALSCSHAHVLYELYPWRRCLRSTPR